MKNSYLVRIGGIFFFIGLILMIISWNYSYPITMPEVNEITFSQFHPFIWPGIILSLLGLFLTGYYSERKSIKAICASLFPIVLYVYVFFFSYIATSDSGGVKAMFEVFHHTGINPSVESYFYYPVYFTLNEMTSQILGIGANGLAVIFFTVFGVLISLYLYLFIFKTTKNDLHQIAFLAVPVYFIAIFTYLNYQWAPQTLALIFFLLLLLLFDKKKIEYKILSIVIFTVLVFTHIFIPAIYLLFLGMYAIKHKEFRNSFLLIGCIYTSLLVYYTTFYLPIILDAFRQTIYGFGEEYAISISRSFMEPKGLASQIISVINRIRIPIIWILLSLGSLMLFLKKKLNFSTIALGISGGFYFIIGLFYSVLGTRALQVLFIPLVVGIGFFITKWKKPTLILVVILLVLSIFGPIRSAYDEHQFQLDEEEQACNFLVDVLPVEKSTRLAIGGVNSGYFSKKLAYMNMDKNNTNGIWMIVPYNPEFENVFKETMEKNEYTLYNPQLGKELISYGWGDKEINIINQKIRHNNKIYECGKTLIAIGT